MSCPRTLRHLNIIIPRHSGLVGTILDLCLSGEGFAQQTTLRLESDRHCLVLQPLTHRLFHLSAVHASVAFAISQPSYEIVSLSRVARICDVSCVTSAFSRVVRICDVSLVISAFFPSLAVAMFHL